MPKTKKPKVVYEWRRQAHSVDADTHESPWRVCWSLYGGNGEFMCGDGGQGYESTAKARDAADLCGQYLFNRGTCLPGGATKEVGPGRKPKA